MKKIILIALSVPVLFGAILIGYFIITGYTNPDDVASTNANIVSVKAVDSYKAKDMMDNKNKIYYQYQFTVVIQLMI